MRKTGRCENVWVLYENMYPFVVGFISVSWTGTPRRVSTTHTCVRCAPQPWAQRVPPWHRSSNTTTHLITLEHTTTHYNTLVVDTQTRMYASMQHTATHLNTLKHTTTHYNTLQHTWTHYNTIQHTTTQYNTIQHTTAQYNTLVVDTQTRMCAMQRHVCLPQCNTFIGKVVFICPVGSVNSVLKFLGQPGKTQFQPGGDEFSSGVPIIFNTKLTEPKGK